MPAERAAAGRSFDVGDGPSDDLPFLVFAEPEVTDKTIAVAAEIEAGMSDHSRNSRIAHQCLGADVDRERNPALDHEVSDPPEADARAILK